VLPARPAIFILVLDRAGDQVVTRLAGGRHRFVVLGGPGTVILIRHVLDAFADPVKLIEASDPAMPVADETPHRLALMRLDAGNHQPGQQPVRHRQRDHARVELRERDPPFLRQGPQHILVVVEQYR